MLDLILGTIQNAGGIILAAVAGLVTLLALFLNIKKAGKDEQRVDQLEERIQDEQEINDSLDRADDADRQLRDEFRDNPDSVRKPDKYLRK